MHLLSWALLCPPFLEKYQIKQQEGGRGQTGGLLFGVLSDEITFMYL